MRGREPRPLTFKSAQIPFAASVTLPASSLPDSLMLVASPLSYTVHGSTAAGFEKGLSINLINA